jgi:biotin carboxyl carrier protein
LKTGKNKPANHFCKGPGLCMLDNLLCVKQSKMAKNYKIKIREKEFNVSLIKCKQSSLKLEVNGETYELEFQQSKPGISTKNAAVSSDLTSSQKQSAVVAPLPGVVSTIHVKKGAKIKAGDKLITLEAMKMENPVIARTDSQIKEVLVKTGQQVKAGELLIKFVF